MPAITTDCVNKRGDAKVFCGNIKEGTTPFEVGRCLTHGGCKGIIKVRFGPPTHGNGKRYAFVKFGTEEQAHICSCLCRIFDFQMIPGHARNVLFTSVCESVADIC